MRCFLAVPLRPPALGAAQEMLERLRGDVGAVRWARPETLHITLHFFGAITDERVAAALDAVRATLNASTRFEIVIDTMGSFPERGRPRVLWLGTSHESQELRQLADGVRSALRAAAFDVEERPFRSHVTLGRPREPWPNEARVAWDDARARGLSPSAFVADRAVLFESVTGREAAAYVNRAGIPFTGAC